MSLPVIAITNVSTCLSDGQVEAVIPALQRQVSLDFKAYWEVECELTFLPKEKPLTEGWWQISVTDNPDRLARWAITNSPAVELRWGKSLRHLISRAADRGQ